MIIAINGERFNRKKEMQEKRNEWALLICYSISGLLQIALYILLLCCWFSLRKCDGDKKMKILDRLTVINKKHSMMKHNIVYNASKENGSGFNRRACSESYSGNIVEKDIESRILELRHPSAFLLSLSLKSLLLKNKSGIFTKQL